MTQFQNKVAVVTGGASGIGQALCEELARRGATVVVADIDSQRAQHVASAIAAQGGRAESAEVDVADAKQMQTLVEQTVSRHERLDYFFNNAAIAVVGELRDLAPEHWRRLVDVNLLGVVYGTMGYKITSLNIYFRKVCGIPYIRIAGYGIGSKYYTNLITLS